jgi:hypothetical protein
MNRNCWSILLLALTPPYGRVHPDNMRSISECFGKLADLIRDHNAATISFRETQARDANASVAVVRNIMAELNPGTYVVEIITSSPDKSVSVSRRTELTVSDK